MITACPAPLTCGGSDSVQVKSGGVGCFCEGVAYSRSPKNPTLQLFQKSSKSASTTPQKPIWNTFGTVAVRDFWENGCTVRVPTFFLLALPSLLDSVHAHSKQTREEATKKQCNDSMLRGAVWGLLLERSRRLSWHSAGSVLTIRPTPILSNWPLMKA